MSNILHSVHHFDNKIYVKCKQTFSLFYLLFNNANRCAKIEQILPLKHHPWLFYFYVTEIKQKQVVLREYNQQQNLLQNPTAIFVMQLRIWLHN